MIGLLLRVYLFSFSNINIMNYEWIFSFNLTVVKQHCSAMVLICVQSIVHAMLMMCKSSVCCFCRGCKTLWYIIYINLWVFLIVWIIYIWKIKTFTFRQEIVGRRNCWKYWVSKQFLKDRLIKYIVKYVVKRHFILWKFWKFKINYIIICNNKI
jgi:hypothetical protein